MAYVQHEDRTKAIIAALTAHGANKPCPRCAYLQFDLVGEAVIPLQQVPGAYSIGGPAIPTAVVACKNCGFISQHALGPLLGGPK